MKKAILAMAVVAAGLCLSTSAQAGLVTGSQSFGTTAITPNGISGSQTALATIGSFSTLTFETGSSQSGNFVGFPVNQLLNNSPLDTTNLANFTLGNATFGTFLSAAGVELASPTNTRTFDLFGAFTPGTSSQFAGMSGQSAELLITFNQTGGAGNAISASASLAAPPTHTIPEPGSMALVGIGAVGLFAGAAFRKRRKVSA